MRDVAVVGIGQTRPVVRETRDEVELVQHVVQAALADSGLDRERIGFTVSGSCDLLAGRPFSFVGALDGVGAWPPIAESHVEMDAAFALYEAWIRLQHGDVDVALVYGFGKPSTGDPTQVAVLQHDPYTVVPLWPDERSVCALQARALLDAGRYCERHFAEVVLRSRASGLQREHAFDLPVESTEALLDRPYVAAPLRAHDCPPVTDGAAAVLLAAGDAAGNASCSRVAWIRGIDHRIDHHALGWRPLEQSPSTQAAAASLDTDGIQLAELHAPYAPQELVLRDALGLREEEVRINRSGGALCANPIMSAGLARLIAAVRGLREGAGDRALAHATSGPCLQQNLVAVLEGA